jgi:hypothetical protein
VRTPWLSQVSAGGEGGGGDTSVKSGSRCDVCSPAPPAWPQARTCSSMTQAASLSTCSPLACVSTPKPALSIAASLSLPRPLVLPRSGNSGAWRVRRTWRCVRGGYLVSGRHCYTTRHTSKAILSPPLPPLAAYPVTHLQQPAPRLLEVVVAERSEVQAECVAAGLRGGAPGQRGLWVGMWRVLPSMHTLSSHAHTRTMRKHAHSTYTNTRTHAP